MIKTKGFQSVWNYLRSISNTDGDIVIDFIFILHFALQTHKIPERSGALTIWKLHLQEH